MSARKRARTRNAPIATFPTWADPVRVYAPTPRCAYYTATWYEPGKARQQRTTLGKVEHEATAWGQRKADALKRRQRSPKPERPSAPFGELVEAYLDPKNSKHWSTRTRERQEYLKRWVAAASSVPCAEVDPEVVQSLIDTAEDHLEPATVKTLRAMLSSIIKLGRERGYILPEQTPMAGVRLTVDHGEDKDDVRVDIDGLPNAGDVAALVDAIASRQDKAMVRLAMRSGMRWGELCALRAGSVDLDRRVIAVRAKLVETTTGALSLETPKGRKVRSTFFPPEMDDDMAWLVEQADGGLLFPAPKGGYQRRSNFGRRVWRKAHSAAGWHEDWSFHTLRHCAAVWMLTDLHLPDTDVASVLGHASSDFTRRVYAQAVRGAADRSAAAAAVAAATMAGTRTTT